MNRGVARQPIFFSDRDRVEFERLLGIARARTGVEVHAYCLMGNHFHLLLHCPAGGLSDYMHQLGSVYVRHVNERLGRDGPLFKSRFKSIVIDSDDFLMTAARYIHRNPLALRPAVALDRYRWSSHRSYVGRRQRPEWLRTDVVLALFDDDPARFDEFVRGTATFPTAPNVEALAELLVDEHELEGSSHGVARTVVVLLVDQLDADRADELGRAIGLHTATARRKALWRARRRLEERPELAPLVNSLRQLAA
jgi:REP element-mobilizing transposase RayT